MHIDWKIADDRLWWWRAYCHNVVDGDTVDLIVDRGFRALGDDRFRLLGIDAPETMRRAPGMTDEQWAAERAAGLKTKARLEALILNKQVLIRSGKTPDKYGRWLVTVYYHDGTEWRSVNETLLNEGLANLYIV